MRRIISVLVVAAVSLLMTGCGDGDSSASESVSVDVPTGSTFCSVFNGEYGNALSNAVPATESGFQESADTITTWARVLQDLAPTEIAALADDNTRYHEAQAQKKSASAFIPGSNEMHNWARGNC